jgi:hypothetical protein
MDYIIDIETIDVEGEKKPYDIALYDGKNDKCYRYLVDCTFQQMLTNTYQFSKPKKYLSGLDCKITSIEKIANEIKALNIKKLIGHNIISFDLPILKNCGITFENIKVFDTYRNVGNLLPLNYYYFCEQNRSTKFFTDSGNIKLTLEAIYCYITDNPDFCLSHIAINDCKVNFEVYQYLISRKKKIISDKFPFMFFKNKWKL